MNLRVVGVNWGDEGKGRFVDYLANEYDVICRFQGGNNAGHTVVNEYGKFKLHLVPSGIFHQNKLNYLGPGVLLNLGALIEEIETLKKCGISWAKERIRISDRATLCLQANVEEDSWEEERLGYKAFGSTKNGIAPGYSDKYLKKSLMLGDLKNRDLCLEKLTTLFEYKNLYAKGLYGKSHDVSVREYVELLVSQYEYIEDSIVNSQSFGIELQGKSVLF